MPLVISLISVLSVLPSLLVKALSRPLSAPSTCNYPQKITFLLQPSPLTSSYCLSSSYLPCSYSSSLVLPLNFLWNNLLKISLLFKWANLTSEPAVSRRWVPVTTKSSFPYQWQRRKCFSLCDIKIPNWWHVPHRALSPWKAALRTRLDDTHLISEVLQKELLPWYKESDLRDKERKRAPIPGSENRFPGGLHSHQPFSGLDKALCGLVWPQSWPCFEQRLLRVLLTWIFLAPYDPTYYFTPSF